MRIVRSIGGALPRHTLVWPAAAPRLVGEMDDADARAAVREWCDAGHPFVVRRSEADSGFAECVAVGLPLPPTRGKRRLSATLAYRDVAFHRAPLTLAEIAAALPPPWRRDVASLDRDARALGVTLRGFGSVAWQAITGFAYLHDDSDVDVTFAPISLAQLDATLALFARWEQRARRRVDGEIVFGTDYAVAWREWARAPSMSRVLVKARGGAALVARAALFDTLAGGSRVRANFVEVAP